MRYECFHFQLVFDGANVERALGVVRFKSTEAEVFAPEASNNGFKQNEFPGYLKEFLHLF